MPTDTAAVLKRNSFLLSLGGAIALAFVWPELGAEDGPLRPGLTTRIGIMLIFLTQGLSLPTEALLRGFAQWRLHLFIQAANFAFLPLLGLLLVTLAGGLVPEPIALGLLFLSFLPTTVSSAIALTSAAEGNVSAAILNTAVSNVLGVFIVPALTLGIAIAAAPVGQQGGDVSEMLRKLSILILLPLAAGQVARPFLRAVLPRIKPYFRPLNNGIIVFMVFTAMCGSMLEGPWKLMGAGEVAATVLLSLTLLLLASASVWFAAARLFHNREDRAAAFYCGSHKSLASGIPMALTIFGSNAELAPHMGLIVLPLIIYHPAQLLLGSLLVDHLRASGSS